VLRPVTQIGAVTATSNIIYANIAIHFAFIADSPALALQEGLDSAGKLAKGCCKTSGRSLESQWQASQSCVRTGLVSKPRENSDLLPSWKHGKKSRRVMVLGVE
jgi:hypothetical protein